MARPSSTPGARMRQAVRSIEEADHRRSMTERVLTLVRFASSRRPTALVAVAGSSSPPDGGPSHLVQVELERLDAAAVAGPRPLLTGPAPS